MPAFQRVLLTLAVALAPLATSAPLAAPAATETPPACDDYRELTHVLGQHYAEAPVSAGLNADGNLLQVFSAPAAGTWTMVSVRPDGRACIVAVGHHWNNTALRPVGDPA